MQTTCPIFNTVDSIQSNRFAFILKTAFPHSNTIDPSSRIMIFIQTCCITDFHKSQFVPMFIENAIFFYEYKVLDVNSISPEKNCDF